MLEVVVDEEDIMFQEQMEALEVEEELEILVLLFIQEGLEIHPP